MKNIILLILPLFFCHTGWSQFVNTYAGPQTGINDAIVFDQHGNLFGSKFALNAVNGSSIYKITPDGVVSTFSTGYSACNGLTFDHSGTLYVVDYTSSTANHQVYKVNNVGVKTAYGPKIPGASGIAIDPLSDTIYVSSYLGNKIVKLAPNGVVTTFCDNALLDGPVGMTFDKQNVLYVANFNDGKVFKVSHNGDSLKFLGEVPSVNSFGIGFIAYANYKIYATGIGVHKIYEIDLNGGVSEFAGTGTPGVINGAVDTASFSRPNGITTNFAGDSLFISDAGSFSIRTISDFVTSNQEVGGAHISEITTFPNPSYSRFELKGDWVNKDDLRVDVLSITGSVIWTSQIVNRSTKSYRLLVSNHDLPKGVYFVNVSSKHASKTTKHVSW